MVKLHFLGISTDGDVESHGVLTEVPAQYAQLLSDDFLASMRALGTQVPFDACFKPLSQAAVKLLSGDIVMSSVGELNDALRPIADASGVEAEQLSQHVKHLIYFVQHSIKQNISAQQVFEDLQALGWQAQQQEQEQQKEDAEAATTGGDGRLEYLVRLWKKFYAPMSRCLLSDTLQVHPLRDLDWRFGVTASSSELSQVGRTFLQMKLRLLESTESQQQRDVFLELTLPQFYEFLHEMEKAKKSLDFFVQS